MTDAPQNPPPQLPQPQPIEASLVVPPAGPAPGGISGKTILVISLACVGALVVIVGFLLALLFPAVQATREAGRRTLCMNNMKQLGLAVHNYHAARGQLPPLATDDRHWSWTATLLPFVEGSRTSTQITLWKAADDPENLAAIRQFRDPILLCPTRSTSRLRSSGVFANGQPNDYAAVSTTQGTTWGETDGLIIYRKQPPSETSDVRSWTTFGMCTDGLSNTAMIGERHMRPDWLGGELDDPALVALANAHTIRVGGDRAARGLAQSVEDGDRWKFGGWHPGTTHFLLGDASVRAVHDTISPRRLKAFLGRADFIPVDLSQ